ncbi:helicase-associated domain-containing protein [Luteimicrobium subarcticum]|uniref:XPB/Ssl2-like helicase family protein n=1 Tax=Luteimicrobium subarcticum TaxID=620910 RepID=A0A2M8WSS9_9MICO|nr:helicase-associated domain-containing protein [Luteimicrobium subarcticum]PJI94002.1 XPB/Ssl2-like helicase family protein [Luteimicrobium subarcticum]
MAEHRSASTFSEALRTRDDDALVALLRARPDLVNPSPSTLRSLAARATGTASTERALADCDRLGLQVLESLVALATLGRPTTPDDVVAALSPADDVDPAALRRSVLVTLADLDARALVWSTPDGFRAAPGVAPLLGLYPAGLGPAAPHPADDLAALLEKARSDGGRGRAVLDALAWGPPVGVAPHEPRAVAAVDRLVADGLLLAPDAGHVVLPGEVGLALRSGRTHRDVRPGPPLPADGRSPAHATVDAEAAQQALEMVRLVTDLLRLWDDEPPTVLRTGGLAVRDLRRLALHLDTDDATAAAAAELALAAELVADDGEVPASFAPTTLADSWLAQDDDARWARLAHAWSASPRAAWLAATRDEQGSVRSALSPDHAVGWAVRLRRTVLDAVGASPVALGPADVRAVLAWEAPRNVPPGDAVDGVLAGARLLGVVALGALSTPGATLLDGDPGGAPDPAALARTAVALDAVLPAPVDDLLVQGDLTGIVPGRPGRDLAELLDAVAEVESRGAALTVRFTPASVERAMAGGLSAEDVLGRIDRHARGPLPQALEYLVRDVARRHGRVRVGAALSYVRVDDPAVVASLLADPALRALGLVGLAPTVVAANIPAARLHEALAAAGVTAVLEGPDGRAVSTARERRRAAPPSGRRGRGRAGGPSTGPPSGRRVDEDARARRVVAELRARDDLARAADHPGATGSTGAGAGPDLDLGPHRAGAAHASGARPGTTPPADTLALLREAIEERRLVDLSTVDGHGTPVIRTVRPLRLDGGRLRAVDPARDAELTVAVHRIASVVPRDD